MANSADLGRAGRAPAEKSTFSLTCSLLNQYLKEKGSFGDLSLGMALALEGKGKSEAIRTMNLLPGVETPADLAPNSDRNNNTTKSMDLFPQHAGFGGSSSPAEDAPRKPEAAQMTIFYGGKVLVFDNFPSNKAKELMAMASKGEVKPSPLPLPTPVAGTPVDHRPQRAPQPFVSALPIARKNSLHRFLEKRKDRVSSAAPYLVNNGSFSSSAPAKLGETKPWLGLAPQLPNKIGGDTQH